MKINQDKIPMTLTEDNVLKIAVEQGVIENEFNWKLVRERDGLTCQSKDIMWIEWNEDGTLKEKHDTFAIGRSLLMSPFNQFFTWQTTPITKIITRRPTANIFYVKFETENSVYRLIKLKNN
tara:strand:- start:1542 stop:1907 length:366 start_codon:yes stop_codon:yes gene_type:complete